MASLLTRFGTCCTKLKKKVKSAASYCQNLLRFCWERKEKKLLQSEQDDGPHKLTKKTQFTPEEAHGFGMMQIQQQSEEGRGEESGCILCSYVVIVPEIPDDSVSYEILNNQGLRIPSEESLSSGEERLRAEFNQTHELGRKNE